jgi:hypothetical protein
MAWIWPILMGSPGGSPLARETHETLQQLDLGASLQARATALETIATVGTCAVTTRRHTIGVEMPPARHSRAHVRTAALCLTLATAVPALALGGCGSSSSAKKPGMASTVVPASAPVYLEAIVKPTGSLKDASLTAARRLTHDQNPVGLLVHALESSPYLGHINFEQDVKPWLGERAGLFLTSISAGTSTSLGVLKLSNGISSEALLSSVEAVLTKASKHAQGAVVLETSNTGAAQSFLQSKASSAGAHSVSFDGSSYVLDSEGLAWGLVGHYVVLGSNTGLQNAIETEHGGSSLGHTEPYSKLAAVSEPGSLGSLYLDTGALSSGGSSVPDLSLLEGLFPSTQQMMLSLIPAASSVTLDADLISSSPALGGEASAALGELPGSSWIAVGFGDVPTTLPANLGLVREVVSLGASTVLASAGGPSLKSFFAALASHKAQLQSELSGWAGKGGLYVSGSGVLELQSGLVIDVTEPTRAKEAVDQIGALMSASGAIVEPVTIAGTEAAASIKLNGFPLTLDMGYGDGKFVIGVGEGSVTGALNPSSRFSSSQAYSAAKKTLEGQFSPTAVVEFPSLVGFVEGLGLGENQATSSVMPYLRSLATLVAGQQDESGVIRARAVLGLGPAEG